jgi:bla regulator protein BlaR1
MIKSVLLVLVIATALSSAFGQLTRPPAFDVASVKPSEPGLTTFHISAHQPVGNLFTATNVTVQKLVMMAYNVADWQLIGAPTWMATEGYDINAKPERPANRDEIYSMVRTLLAERFKLAMHTETKELHLYALVLDKAGSKMRINENGGPPHVSERLGHAVFRNVPLIRLTNFLSVEAGHIVVDKTSLTGSYDFTLDFVSSRRAINSNGPSGPTIFEAVKDQLGMKLEPGKGPIDLFVIDHVERPSEN